MIQLFLSEPKWGDGLDDGSADLRISLLNSLESILWSLILSSGGRSEARLWFYRAISDISSINSCQQQELFAALLRSNPIKKRLAAQLLQLIFEKRPHKVGKVLAKKSYMLKNFFEGNSRRIFQWFSNFSTGGVKLGKGAKALSKFAFVNRDICWEELEWKGKHGQSPAMVATKPHYFLDLDIQRTVDNFIENVPEFWSSNEFAESLEDGEILSIDNKFFIDLFVDLMYKEDFKEVWKVINEFLLEESFSFLCNHLLIVFEERHFCVFLELIQKYLNSEINPKEFDKPSRWLELVISKCGDASVEQLLLLNAVINQGRQLLLLLRDEEVREEKAQIKNIAMQICTDSSSANSLAPITKEWYKSKSTKVIKWLGLQSWVLHYLLWEKCTTMESWELLFINNGVSFRKSDESLHHEDFFEQNGSDLDCRASLRVGRKRKGKSRKKRRRSSDDNDSYNDEPWGADMSRNRLQSSAGRWFLSTDGYSTLWNSGDLPEHLSKHCLSTWMKYLFNEE